jgi:hypothetical protein
MEITYKNTTVKLTEHESEDAAYKAGFAQGKKGEPNTPSNAYSDHYSRGHRDGARAGNTSNGQHATDQMTPMPLPGHTEESLGECGCKVGDYVTWINPSDNNDAPVGQVQEIDTEMATIKFNDGSVDTVDVNDIKPLNGNIGEAGAGFTNSGLFAVGDEITNKVNGLDAKVAAFCPPGAVGYDVLIEYPDGSQDGVKAIDIVKSGTATKLPVGQE